MIFLFQQVEMDTTEVSQSIFSILWQSGLLGMVILFVLFLLSIYALYIFIERYMTIQRAAKVDEKFMQEIRRYVQNNEFQAAVRLCQSNDSPVARMVEKGLLRIGKPLRDINTAIENTGNLELFRLEKNLSRLATIAGAAPMIGFFGTVTGMIIAFYEMATQENVTPDVLAGGIYQALLTTAFGLFIGILAFVGYNILVSYIDKVVFKMEAGSLEFMDLLQEPAV